MPSVRETGTHVTIVSSCPSLRARISLQPVGTTTTTFSNLRFKVNVLLCCSNTAPLHHIMFSLSLQYVQVHHPVRPTGTHARGLAGGAEPHYPEPAGLWHSDERWDSPLKPLRSSTPWPLTSKPRLVERACLSHRHKKNLEPRAVCHECALRETINITGDDLERLFLTELLQEDAWRVPHHRPRPPSHYCTYTLINVVTGLWVLVNLQDIKSSFHLTCFAQGWSKSGVFYISTHEITVHVHSLSIRTFFFFKSTNGFFYDLWIYTVLFLMLKWILLII